MAKIIKAADWEGDFLNIYEQIERKDLSPNAIEHKWIPHGVAKQGTSLNANFLNEIQKNSIYGILETNYKNIDNIDKYTIMNFEGIGDTGVFKDLKIKVLITNTNKYDSPKIVINSKEYSILYSVKSGIQNLKKELFVENQVYNMTYNGIGFIIENGNFKATENELGTLTLNDVRKEIARLSGGPYGGLFGAELTSIIKDKMYIYINEDGNGSVCKAVSTKNNSAGFIIPNTTDFIDITNNNLDTIMNVKYNVVENAFLLFEIPHTATNETVLDMGRPFRLANVIVKLDKYGVIDQEVSLVVPYNSEARFRCALPAVSPPSGEVIKTDWNRVHLKIISDGTKLKISAGNQTGFAYPLRVTILKIDIII